MKFAETGIKAGFALNGGAMVALPTFAALFKVNVSAAWCYILAAAIFLSIGVLSSWLTCFLAYLGTTAAEEGAHKITDQLDIENDARFAEPEYRATALAYNKEGVKKLDDAKWYRHSALLSAVASGFFFILGAGISGYTVIKFAGS